MFVGIGAVWLGDLKKRIGTLSRAAGCGETRIKRAPSPRFNGYSINSKDTGQGSAGFLAWEPSNRRRAGSIFSVLSAAASRC